MLKIQIIISRVFIYVITAIFSFSSFPSMAQSLGNETASSNGAVFETGVNKIVNTFLFSGNARIDLDIIYGKINLEQAYKGAALRTDQTAFRDDESFAFRYSAPLDENINMFFKQKWLFSSDSRSIGINELERLNGLIGFRYALPDKSFLEFAAGKENNTQLNAQSTGMIYDFSGALTRRNIFDFDMQSQLKGEITKLNDDRLNKDITFGAAIEKVYDEKNNIRVDGNYKLLNRDFLSGVNNISGLSPYTLETRAESSFGLNSNLDFSFSEKIYGGIGFSYNKLSVGRSYKEGNPEKPVMNVIRQLNETRVSFAPEIAIDTKNFFQSLGFSFETRTEESGVQKKFSVLQTDEEELRAAEKLRDNVSSRTRLKSSTKYNFSGKDTLAANISVSLFQYDTPSEFNNDDRDEFNSIVKVAYTRLFSDFLKGNFIGEFQMHHLVFLESSKSAMNNWNRIIRFGPEFEYRGRFLELNPKFEVLANYTVYDYEGIQPGIKSYSFRQIRYADSICAIPASKYRLQAGINIRYYERGILYWKSFSENPQSGNFEAFFNLLLFYKSDEKISIGSGLRYYSLTQKNLSETNAYGGETSMKSYGPETAIHLTFNSGSMITLNGWYEFQFGSERKAKKIPSFLLNTVIFF